VQKASYTAYDYSRADWEGMYNALMNHNFHHFYLLSDVEEVWATLKHILQTTIQAFVPQFLVKKKQHPKWFTPAIKHRLNCVHSLRKKCKKKPSDNLKLKLQAEEDNLQVLITEAKSEYEAKLINNYSANNNLIYKYISSLSKIDGFPPQMHLGTDTATCDQDKAELFNSYFYSVFNDKESTNESWTNSNNAFVTTLSDIAITTEDVHEALVALDPNKAMGPDGISLKVLKYCADVLCQPISYLFQLTITNSYLPSE